MRGGEGVEGGADGLPGGCGTGGGGGGVRVFTLCSGIEAETKQGAEEELQYKEEQPIEMTNPCSTG